MNMLVTCLTLCDPMPCNQPGSSAHGILQQEYWSGSYSLLQGIFPTQGSNLGLLHCRQVLYHLSHQGSTHICVYVCVYIYIHTHKYIHNRIHTHREIYTHNRILLSYQKEWNNSICNNMNGPRDYHTSWSKSEEKDKYHMISLICGI